MKILKLLNKKYLSIYIFSSLIFFSHLSAEEEPVDIWDLDKEPKENSSDLINDENVESDEIKSVIEKSLSEKQISVIDSNSLDENIINIAGLYDPEDNGLSMNMWSNSNGKEIKVILEKLNKTNLSNDAKEIFDIVLLTNSYFPEEDITEEEKLKESAGEEELAGVSEID